MRRGFPNVVSKKTAVLRTRWIVKNCLAILSPLLLLGPAGAFNYVTDANGTWWGIQDAASPRVDTGSIRATQTAPGVSGPYSTSINGFGGIRVLVETTPAPRFNGEIMRGFGLTFDGVNRFATTKSVDLGGVSISRSVYVNNGENWGRWLDTFTNTTRSPITIKVAFGGQSGMGVTGANSSSIVNTSSGDAIVTAADSWVEVATPLADATLVGGPQVTVIGTPSSTARPFSGAITFAGNWLYDPFDKPLTYAGHEANFQAYVNTLTLNPGHSRSLLHFVVLGQMVNAASSADVRAAVETTATNLAAAPAIGDLTVAEVCSIDNFDIAALTANGFDYSNCTGEDTRGRAAAGAEGTAGENQREVRRGREDDRPVARRHGVRCHDVGGDHAGVPRPDQGLRPGTVRVQRLRDRRRRRAGAGQGRR